MKTKTWIIGLLVLTMVAFSGCTAVTGTTTPTTSTTSSTPPAQTVAATTQPPLTNAPVTAAPPSSSISVPVPSSVADLQSTVEAIYKAVNPSVVSISVTLPPSATSTGGGAQGSGFIWDASGDIVTNNHVVSGATSMTVTFYDGTTVDATLVGTDVDSDLAVIKVNASSSLLKPVTMGNSTTLQVGQLAVAVGNPFGLQNTLTVGFVSGLGRLLPTNVNAVGPTYSIPDIIQTDAAINPGNSGGVLLNDQGHVIGVTQSIETTTGTFSGIGFAIPAQIVKQVVPSLISTGHYEHPYLGISVTSLSPTLAKAMNLPSDQRGALVETVTAGGPASKAGLQGSTQPVTVLGGQVDVGGDVITAINGQTVKSSDDLITILANTGSVGETVPLTILRNGKQMQLQVTLGARPASPPQ